MGWGGVGWGGWGKNVHATLLPVLFHFHTDIHATLLSVLWHFRSSMAVALGKLNLPRLEPAHGSYFCEEQRVKKKSGRCLRFEGISLKMGAQTFEEKR